MGLAVAACLAVVALSQALRWLNLGHLARHGDEVPPGFEAELDPARLARAAGYGRDAGRAEAFAALLTSFLVLGFVFGGGLGWYDRWIRAAAGTGTGAGILFFVGLHWGSALACLPFAAHRVFAVEARHGFNTTTPRLWLSDLLKAQAVSTSLVAGLAAGSLALLAWSPQRWWLWVWGLLVGASILLQYLSPVLIEPLFSRFEPLSDPALADRVRTLADRAGVRVERVLRVDASRRSRHANAYFAGVGRVRRVVLFDTLLERLSSDQVLAVLAHELGHWRLGHVTRRVGGGAAVALGALFTASRLLGAEALPAVAGLDNASVPTRLLILGVLASLAAFPLTPLASALSRRHERAADRFACRLTGKPEDLASALISLSRENLANLHPHPLYAWFHCSHPSPVDRIKRLREAQGPDTGSGL